jgi:hypothetical protein
MVVASWRLYLFFLLLYFSLVYDLKNVKLKKVNKNVQIRKIFILKNVQIQKMLKIWKLIRLWKYSDFENVQIFLKNVKKYSGENHHNSVFISIPLYHYIVHQFLNLDLPPISRSFLPLE